MSGNTSAPPSRRPELRTGSPPARSCAALDPQRLPRPEDTQPARIRWDYVIGLVVVHLLALLALAPWFFSWTGLVLAVFGLYVFGTLGINLAYHRLLTHQGLRLPKWLERGLTTLGVCCLEDAPALWVATHRVHHQHSDERPDPHSPLVALVWGHVGWLLVENRQVHSAACLDRYARDILRDRYYMWLGKGLNWLWVYLAHALLFWALGWGVGWALSGSVWEGVRFGLSLLVWGVALRTVMVWHITWSVNSLSHLWGYQNYETGENSRNNWLVALLSNGEGWHNNHHADQRSAAHGHRWWEFDVTWWTIRLLALVGLAQNVVGPRCGRVGPQKRVDAPCQESAPQV